MVVQDLKVRFIVQVDAAWSRRTGGQVLTARSQARSTGKLLESAALANRPDLAEKWLRALWPPGHRSSFAGEPSLGLPVDDAAVSTMAALGWVRVPC